MNGPSSPSRRRQTPSHSPPLPPVSNNDAAISDSLKRLSLSTATKTALPESSPISPKKGYNGSTVNSPVRQLRRNSSSLGREQRSTTPTLNKKSSRSSLQGGSGLPSPRPSVSRRSSSNNFASSPSAMPFRPTPPSVPEPLASPPSITPESVAKAYFEAEVKEHSEETANAKSGKTVIILHDSCYGHRYSRPRTSKASLSTIVERPERIHASILGVSAAYIRLGSRHSEGKYGPHPKRNPQDIPNLPFRIHKSSRTVALSSPIVTSVHGAQWMDELKLMCDAAESKLTLDGKELVRPEQSGSLTDNEEKPRLHEGDLYLCADSLNALEGCIGAVCDGVDRVFESLAPNGPSRAFVCIRPPGHHCSSTYPSGFCWLNNVHIGIAHASAVHGLTHAAIIDFDLHHGDGSQAITWAHNAKVARLPKNAAASKKTAIGYFSLHDINSYPCEMGDEEKIKNASLCIENAHGQTIWNVHLQPWKHDGEFWELYETRYAVLLEKTRAFLKLHTQRLLSALNQPRPKAAIFLSSGFDASEWEGAGMQRHKVNVPTDFYARLTSDVVRMAEEEGLGADGRIISVLEGGYSDRALCSGVLSHLSGLAGTDPLTVDRDDVDQHRLGGEMGRRIGTVDGESQETSSERSEVPTAYDSKWWALRRLEELEALVHPPPPPPPPKKPRTVVPPTYSTPTQSFNAKVVASPKVRCTPSSTGLQSSPRSPFSRAPTPPPPEVDWVTAAHELSKLLIPSDRQTKSHKAEDLSVESNKVKKERRTSVGPLIDGEMVDGKRMQLRDRKARAPTNILEEPAEGDHASKANRRRTVAGGSLVSDDGIVQPSNGIVPSRPRRRSSAASSLGSVLGDSPAMTAPKGPSTVSSTRPGSSGTSGTSRPASSMSLKSTNASVTSRKPRNTIPKSDATRPRVLKKSSLPPPLPSNASNSTNMTGPLPDPPTEPLAVNTTDADLESLNSGMKKMQIKLKVPTKEEHDAREKKKAAEKKTVTKAPRKPAAPRVPKAAGSKKTGLKTNEIAPALPPKVEDESVAAPDDAKFVSQLPLAVSTSLQSQHASQQPSTFSDIAPTVTATAHSGPQPETLKMEFIPYNPQTHEPPPPIQQEPLTWLPPNTSTPQFTKTRSDLPAFTSSSPIPFGKMNGVSSVDSAESTQPHASLPLSSQQQQQQQIGLGEKGQADTEMEAVTNTKDIWDIPATPKH